MHRIFHASSTLARRAAILYRHSGPRRPRPKPADSAPTGWALRAGKPRILALLARVSGAPLRAPAGAFEPRPQRELPAGARRRSGLAAARPDHRRRRHRQRAGPQQRQRRFRQRRTGERGPSAAPGDRILIGKQEVLLRATLRSSLMADSSTHRFTAETLHGVDGSAIRQSLAAPRPTRRPEQQRTTPATGIHVDDESGKRRIRVTRWSCWAAWPTRSWRSAEAKKPSAFSPLPAQHARRREGRRPTRRAARRARRALRGEARPGYRQGALGGLRLRSLSRFCSARCPGPPSISSTRCCATFPASVCRASASTSRLCGPHRCAWARPSAFWSSGSRVWSGWPR